MERRVYQLAGFTDAEGRLQTHLGGISEVLVPPAVEVGDVAYYSGEKVQSIIYPIPSKWRKRLPVAQGGAIGAYPLQELGWYERTHTTGLLEDLIDIAQGSAEAVQAFVLRWGPLWVCARHSEYDFDCIWKFPDWEVDTVPEGDACEWFASEPVELFRRKAREARAAFGMARLLMEGKPVSADYLTDLKMPRILPDFEIDVQRRRLARHISGNISRAGGPSLSLVWEQGERPRIVVKTGLGFFRLAWLQIAQIISGATGLYVCDGCGLPYIREKRKPAEGKSNYCDNCGKRAANRQLARRRRKTAGAN
jgi:hypothetical protein